MKKILLWIIVILSSLLILIYAFNVEYLFKGVRTIYFTGNNTAFISDYEYFDNREIKSTNTQPWALHKKYNTINESDELKKLNVETDTKSFLVIDNDSIIFEKYYDGHKQSDISNTFSVTKSIITSMMGKAIMQGKIESLQQPISDFFEEYKDGIASELTVGDLASMSSGMKWSEKYYNPINITSESYFTDDLRSVILGQEIESRPGQGFRYSSGDTQLLGMVIEKATGTTLSDYLTQNFWIPMGAETTALWQIDSEKSGMEKAYCCISASARDLARFGKLYINKGKWDNTEILDSTFVKLSLKPVFDETPSYGYGWWLYKHEGKEVFAMRGHRGQFVISFPDENIIIVRQGEDVKKDGDGTSDLFKYIAEGYKMANSID